MAVVVEERRSSYGHIKGSWVRCRLRLDCMEWGQSSTPHAITTCTGPPWG